MRALLKQLEVEEKPHVYFAIRNSLNRLAKRGIILEKDEARVDFNKLVKKLTENGRGVGDNAWQERQTAAYGLIAFEDQESLRALLKQLEVEQDSSVLSAIFQSIRSFAERKIFLEGDDVNECLDKMVRKLTSNGYMEGGARRKKRLAGVYGLVLFEDKKSLRALLEQLVVEEDGVVFCAIGDSIRSLVGRGVVLDGVEAQEDLDKFIKQLTENVSGSDDDMHKAREAAAYGLMAFDDQKSLHALLSQLKVEEDDEVAWVIAKSLSCFAKRGVRLKEEYANEYLEELITKLTENGCHGIDGKFRERQAAAYGLVVLGKEEEGARALLKQFKVEDTEEGIAALVECLCIYWQNCTNREQEFARNFGSVEDREKTIALALLVSDCYYGKYIADDESMKAVVDGVISAFKALLSTEEMTGQYNSATEDLAKQLNVIFGALLSNDEKLNVYEILKEQEEGTDNCVPLTISRDQFKKQYVEPYLRSDDSILIPATVEHLFVVAAILKHLRDGVSEITIDIDDFISLTDFDDVILFGDLSKRTIQTVINMSHIVSSDKQDDRIKVRLDNGKLILSNLDKIDNKEFVEYLYETVRALTVYFSEYKSAYDGNFQAYAEDIMRGHLNIRDEDKPHLNDMFPEFETEFANIVSAVKLALWGNDDAPLENEEGLSLRTHRKDISFGHYNELGDELIVEGCIPEGRMFLEFGRVIAWKDSWTDEDQRYFDAKVSKMNDAIRDLFEAMTRKGDSHEGFTMFNHYKKTNETGDGKVGRIKVIGVEIPDDQLKYWGFIKSITELTGENLIEIDAFGVKELNLNSYESFDMTGDDHESGFPSIKLHPAGQKINFGEEFNGQHNFVVPNGKVFIEVYEYDGLNRIAAEEGELLVEILFGELNSKKENFDGVFKSRTYQAVQVSEYDGTGTERTKLGLLVSESIVDAVVAYLKGKNLIKTEDAKAPQSGDENLPATKVKFGEIPLYGSLIRDLLEELKDAGEVAFSQSEEGFYLIDVKTPFQFTQSLSNSESGKPGVDLRCDFILEPDDPFVRYSIRQPVKRGRSKNTKAEGSVLVLRGLDGKIYMTRIAYEAMRQLPEKVKNIICNEEEVHEIYEHFVGLYLKSAHNDDMTMQLIMRNINETIDWFMQKSGMDFNIKNVLQKIFTQTKIQNYLMERGNVTGNKLHEEAELLEKLDTFLYEITLRSDEVKNKALAYISNLSLIDLAAFLNNSINASFLDDFIYSIEKPETKYLLINGRVFLHDDNLENGKVAARNGGCIGTAVNSFLADQIDKHKRNRLEDNGKVDVKLVVFLEGDGTEERLLKEYLGSDVCDRIDTWVVGSSTEDVYNQVIKKGILPEKIAGVINENRTGAFSEANSVYSFFVQEKKIVKHTAYKELNPNILDPVEEFRREENIFIQAPTFFSAAEAVFNIHNFNLSEDSPLMNSKIIEVGAEVAKHLRRFMEEVRIHNNSVRSAA